MEYVIPYVKKTSTDSIRNAVKKAVEYINSHYFEELSLASLAEQFNVESSYFSKIFRQETGETVMVYITRLRIEKAQEYMKKQEISLTEIAFLVGYDDYTYFSRVFRKMVGKSPRDYRGSMMLRENEVLENGSRFGCSCDFRGMRQRRERNAPSRREKDCSVYTGRSVYAGCWHRGYDY